MHHQISPFQLCIFYLMARLASVGAMASSTGMPGNLLPALILGGLLQTALLVLCQLLFRPGKPYPEQSGRAHWGAAGPAWLFFLLLCGWTAAQDGLMLAGIYQRERMLAGMTALLLAAGVYGAASGTEAAARSVPLLALLIVPSLFVFGIGMFSRGEIWNLSPPDWNMNQIAALSLVAGAAPELPVLLFLLPDSTSGFRPRWNVVMGLLPAAFGLLLTAGTMAALGNSRAGADSQLGLAAQSGELLFLRRMDGVFMIAWTLLSLIQITFCCLALWKAGGLFLPVQKKHPLTTAAVCFLLMWGLASLFQQGDSLGQWFYLGVGGTLAGAAALPVWFAALSGRGRK